MSRAPNDSANAHRGHLGIALLAAAETLRISVPTLGDAWIGTASRQRCDDRLRTWAARLIRQARIDLRVEGTFPTGGPYVVMSNHQSMYDIPVVYHLYPHSLRMVAKRELFSLPIWGRALRAAEFIAVDRRNSEEARKSLAIAEKRLAEGVHIWISPEGTRSPTRHLGRFKRGGFRLAVATGASILPITIDGTHHIMPKGAWTVSPGHPVRVTVHPVVDPKSYGLTSRSSVAPVTDLDVENTAPEAFSALLDDVRRQIGSGLRELPPPSHT